MTDDKSSSTPKIKKKQKAKMEKKKVEKKKTKRSPQREWSKGVAIFDKANDQTTYADILRKVKNNTNLKDLVENVV